MTPITLAKRAKLLKPSPILMLAAKAGGELGAADAAMYRSFLMKIKGFAQVPHAAWR